MANFNKVILAGNMTRDPILTYTPKGTAVAKFGMAINRNWTTESGEKKEEVTFVDVDCFGRTAENVAQYCKKGSSVLVEGRLNLSEWNDKATGAKRSKLGVIVETCQFLGGRSDGQKSEGGGQRAEPPVTEAPAGADDSVPF